MLNKTVDWTPEGRKKRKHKCSVKDANSPSEEVTKVGILRPYKDATIKNNSCR